MPQSFRIALLVLILVFLLWAVSGCATRKADPAPPPTAIQVSTPCAALEDVPELPPVTPDATLKVLGSSCKAGNQPACAQAVYAIALDRERLKAWVSIATAAVQGCRK